MKSFASVAPGAVWTAIIAGLMLLAGWLAQYFGDVTWIPPLVGFLAAVLVPVLKVLAEGDPPAARAEFGAPARSKLARWLW